MENRRGKWLIGFELSIHFRGKTFLNGAAKSGGGLSSAGSEGAKISHTLGAGLHVLHRK